jgi:hypothetical protein
LKANKDFSPLPVRDGDEFYPNGIFEFNITRILEEIHRHPERFPLEEAVVSDFPKCFSVINESHLEAVDLTRPVILAEIAPGRYNLIDGNHRMEKARRQGLKTLPAYWLGVQQHLKFLTSQRAYDAYVEYWNDKLRRGMKRL